MKHPSRVGQAALRSLALAVSVVASGAVHAAVGPAGAVSAGGGMENIAYGTGGSIFQLEPMLFVQGLGSANDPGSVIALNPLLQYSFAVAGEGSALMTIDYRVHNTSTTESFDDLRFMLFTNPDGDSIDFLDMLSETWGAAAPGDPVRREGRAFFDPTDTIISNFQFNNDLTEGLTPLDADCMVVTGCDATVGMQWNAALLGPGETFVVRVGLSDDGQLLSSRSIDVSAINTPDTVLTLSGVSSIVPVPDPASCGLLVSGLATLAAAARRRRAR